MSSDVTPTLLRACSRNPATTLRGGWPRGGGGVSPDRRQPLQGEWEGGEGEAALPDTEGHRPRSGWSPQEGRAPSLCEAATLVPPTAVQQPHRARCPIVRVTHEAALLSAAGHQDGTHHMHLCGLRQATDPLWASVSMSEIWGK